MLSLRVMHSPTRKSARRTLGRTARKTNGTKARPTSAAKAGAASGNGAPEGAALREQLRSLSARLLEAREQERAAISRRVHDELGQTLTALQWDVGWLSERLCGLQNDANRAVEARIAGMAASIATALETVHKVACELRPPLLDQFGLAIAMRSEVEQFRTRYSVPCEFIADPSSRPTNRCVATAIFRIFQEILTNIVRHAQATQVRARLSEDADAVLLVVSDNGRGITATGPSKSLGILGMHERAWLLGGEVTIRTTPGIGTAVEVRVPHAQQLEDDAPALGFPTRAPAISQPLDPADLG